MEFNEKLNSGQKAWYEHNEKGAFYDMLLFTHGKKPKKSVLDQAYFSHLFWLFTMSKKLIFCKKYFLQHVHFLLIVKSHFTPLAFYPE